ncbi:MAG: DUF3107 family protein [Actinomycetales bacterium]|uniref:DUF3107 family protein n=1 Tax=Candidatus Phosphoribacter hodrii TaxID=2953743 RepID=A0A935MFV8_9MICO|nr:DUF3107 family protein [Candidatus Phosphoribacter hodrii]
MSPARLRSSDQRDPGCHRRCRGRRAARMAACFDLADDKGRRYFIPAAVIGFVHVGEAEKGKVGFGAH